VRILLVAANTCAAVLSLVWLWGNSSSLSSGWELWFALGYLLLTLANLTYLIRRGRRHYGREQGMPGNEARGPPGGAQLEPLDAGIPYHPVSRPRFCSSSQPISGAKYSAIARVEISSPVASRSTLRQSSVPPLAMMSRRKRPTCLFPA